MSLNTKKVNSYFSSKQQLKYSDIWWQVCNKLDQYNTLGIKHASPFILITTVIAGLRGKFIFWKRV